MSTPYDVMAHETSQLQFVIITWRKVIITTNGPSVFDIYTGWAKKTDHF